jgi:hypothetical protein
MTSRRIRLLLVVTALVGCRNEHRPVLQPELLPLALGPTPCSPLAVDTAGWRDVRSRWQMFSIRLPPPAGEDSVQCWDSPCGRLRAAGWRMGYDMGDFAGPGTDVRLGDGVHLAGACDEVINGRTAHLATGRYAGDIPYARAGGPRQFQAAVAFERGVGSPQLYLSLTTPDVGAVRQFLAAVRTVRFHTAPPEAEPSERPPN